MNICKKVYALLLSLIFLFVFQNITCFGQVFGDINNSENQEEKVNNFIFRENIKTVQMHPEGWELGFPIMNINENTPLVFSFDELGDESKNYSYTYIHCDSDWVPTDILQSDYISGLPDGIINDYELSRNTLMHYTHYTLKIPNEDMRPTLAGNYVLLVYEDFDRANPVITSKFYIVDYLVEIDGIAKRTEDMLHFDTAQEVDFEIKHNKLQLDDPDKNIRVCILQNNNELTAIKDLRPTFVQNNVLIYNYEEENQFPGLSEFRYFDTKNIKYISDRIEKTVFHRPYQHAYLLPDANRSIEKYDFYEDLNGKFFIKRDEGSDSRLDADYVIMHFYLPFESPLSSADVYVYGGLSNWSLMPDLKMKYNPDIRGYELLAPFKQGLYNYQYAFVHKNGNPNFPMFEGSHFETENDYMIFVYYKDFRKRYETLVGFKILNTIPKSTF